MFEKIFKLQENKTTISREIIAGLVTFMTMAYIIFVNPNILSGGPGMENLKFPLIVATCLAAGLTTICMGLFSNYPLALASGMGLNGALVGVMYAMGISWQTAMGIIFIEGIIVTLLVVTNVREWVMDAIPLDLKRAIGVGIGLFIALIGLNGAKLVETGKFTILNFGKLGPESLIALFGLVIILVLMSLKVKGAILIGILSSTILALITQVLKIPADYQWVSGLQPDAFKTIFALDIKGALSLGLATTIFAFLITDFFDTMGTVVAVGEEAGYVTNEGKVPRLKQVLLVDSLAAVCGGLFGCSSVTTYIESASGVGEGGRTGLTSVVTGILFLLAIFFAGIIGIVPGYATAPALIVVGFLMLTVVKGIKWDDFSSAFPAFLTIIMIPFTYSISKGIGYGFISYAAIKVFTGKYKDVHPLMYIAALAFMLDFLLASI